jgi:hypothetical protein
MSKKPQSTPAAEPTASTEAEPAQATTDAPAAPAEPQPTQAACAGCAALELRLTALESMVLEQGASLERVAQAGATGDQQLAQAIEALASTPVPTAAHASGDHTHPELEQRLARLEGANPAAAALTVPALQLALKANPYAELRVLAAWDHASAGAMSEGRTFRADQMPRVIDWVQAGLKVALAS